MSSARNPREIIDNALSENRLGEGFCYFLVLLFAGGGVTALLVGAFRGEGVVALSGAVGAGLFWPALHYARAIRQQNINLRMLEIPLSMATTAKAAAAALQQVFLAAAQPTVPKKEGE